MAGLKYKIIKDFNGIKAGTICEFFTILDDLSLDPTIYQPIQPDEAECECACHSEDNGAWIKEKDDCKCNCHQPHPSEGEIEKLPNNKYPEHMTFDDVIDLQIKVNELIDAVNTLKGKVK